MTQIIQVIDYIVAFLSTAVLVSLVIIYVTYDWRWYRSRTRKVLDSNKDAVAIVIYQNENFKNEAERYICSSEHSLVPDKKRITYYQYIESDGLSVNIKGVRDIKNPPKPVELQMKSGKSKKTLWHSPSHVHLFVEDSIPPAIVYPLAQKYDNTLSTILYVKGKNGFICMNNMVRRTKTSHDYKAELWGGLYEYFGEE